jgi:hypothetical protein
MCSMLLNLHLQLCSAAAELQSSLQLSDQKESRINCQHTDQQQQQLVISTVHISISLCTITL